jgi:hypothetical protein
VTDTDQLAAFASDALARAAHLLETQPHLSTDYRFALSRVLARESAPSVESCVSRAAHALIVALVLDRADVLDPTSGEAA